MSVTTKKRFVMKQAESELFLPKENEIVARVLRSPGRNLHEVEDEKGEKYLASMPRKFRETIYIKRNNFVFVMPIEEGVKVKAEITQILDNENILYLRQQKIWPRRFHTYAESITREAKRGVSGSGIRKHDVIDEDMLPPSDTDDGDEVPDENEARNEEGVSRENERKEADDEAETSSEDEGNRVDDDVDDDDDGDNDDDCTPGFKVYNPNRQRRL